MEEMSRSRSAPLHERRESKRVSGIEKVDKWKRESVEMLVGKAEVETAMAAPATAPPRKSKKASWLDY
jgi:hypothetical protein